MELRQYALLVWRWLWLIVLGALLAGGAAYINSRSIQPVYSASVTLLINQAPNSTNVTDYSSLITSERLARTYAQLLRTPKVLEQVARELDLPGTPGVQVSLVNDTQLLNVSVEDTDPDRAAAVANKVAEVFSQMIEAQQRARYASLKESLEERIKQTENDIAETQAMIDGMNASLSFPSDADLSRLQTALTQYRNTYANLLGNLAQVRLAEAQAVSSVEVVQEARPRRSPIRPRTRDNTLLAAMVGAMLAVGAAFLIEYLDDTVKSPDDVEQIARVAPLGVIGRIEGEALPQKLVTYHSPRSPISEAYRVLRTNIQFGSVDKPLRSLLVTSSEPVEGKSNTAANLAVALAQAGQRVVVVDADLRKPTLHKYFELTNDHGLTTALLNGQSPIQTHLQASEVDNLRVLSSGPLPPNPAELLGSRRLGQIVEELKQEADVIIFDSPPLLPLADAALLSSQVDGTLLVADAGATRRGSLARALTVLQSASAHVLGVALNRFMPSRSGYYYSYRYYHYYTSSEDGRDKKRSWWSRLRWPWRRRSRSGRQHGGDQASG